MFQMDEHIKLYKVSLLEVIFVERVNVYSNLKCSTTMTCSSELLK